MTDIAAPLPTSAADSATYVRWREICPRCQCGFAGLDEAEALRMVIAHMAKDHPGSQQPAKRITGRVVLRVSDIGLFTMMHLPDGISLVAAGAEHSPLSPPERADVLVLTVDMPGVPDGAVTAEPVYTHSGHRDPVDLAGMRWYRADGSEIKQEPAAESR